MKYMSDRQFEKEMEALECKNRQLEMRKALKAEKRKHFPKFRKPSTSKLILLVVFLLCLEIVGFCEYAMFKWGDMSAMYVLVGMPVTFVPIVIGYFNKSRAENTEGGVIYETAMHNLGMTDDGGAV